MVLTNRRIIYPNQYNSVSDNSASYPKQGFKNYGEIRYLGEISTGRIPLVPGLSYIHMGQKKSPKKKCMLEKQFHPERRKK